MRGLGTMGCGVWLGVCLLAGAQGAPKKVKVALKTSSGQDAGTATLKQGAKGVQLKLSLQNLPPGEHGVHIHQNPVCEGPDFKTSGGHFNPTSKQHGYNNPMGHHAGDLPKNVKIGDDHKGSGSFVLSDVTLDPNAPNSLFANGGTSLMVHEKADDMKTDPSGASGNRIACGVIKQ